MDVDDTVTVAMIIVTMLTSVLTSACRSLIQHAHEIWITKPHVELVP